MMTNPANERKTDVKARKRIPMSTAVLKLAVPEIPGYKTYWFVDRNVPRAVQGGYEFVTDQDGIDLNATCIASDKTLSGNTDMGTHIRMWGGVGQNGQAEYLTLMKIRIEFWDEDRASIAKTNLDKMKAIFVDEKMMGSENVNPQDRNKMYVKQANTSIPLFNRTKSY